MDTTKYSTFQTVFFILSVAQCINSLNQPPFAKNVANSAQDFLHDDSGEMNNEIDASTFVRGSNKQNTNGKRGRFYNFNSQRTETQFKSAHQEKSSFQQESQFPAVQQTYWKQVSNREPASIVSFFTDDDDEPKTIQKIDASLNMNSETNTGTFQKDQNNQIDFLTQKAHNFQVADSHQNHKEQNIDFVKNVGQDNHFPFSLKGLNDAELKFFGVPNDSNEVITGNQHFVREETLPRFEDQGKEFFYSKGRNRFSKNSSFYKNVESSFSSEELDDSTEAIDGSEHTASVVATDNTKSSKIYYFGKDKDISGESQENLPIISGVSSNKTALLHQRGINPENLVQSELQEKLPNISVILSAASPDFPGLIHKTWPRITKKKNYSIKMLGNLPNPSVKTKHEQNVYGKSRGVIVKNLMLGSGSSAEAPASIISQSRSKIAAKRTILAGETNLNSQKGLTGNARVISSHNINTSSRNNLKNRWKSQAFIFGIKSDSNDSLKESKLRNVNMNPNSQFNKGMETVLRKEIFRFVPNSQSRLLKGKKNNVFIHNINLGSENSFDSRSFKRFGLSVNSDSVRRQFGKLNNRETGIKRETTGINSAKKVNFENELVTLPTKEIFTFEPVPKNSFTIEKNNVFVKNIKLGSGDYSARGKKRIFESRPLQENGFLSDNNSSMGKTIGKLLKSDSSPHLTKQTNSIFESHFKRKSKEKERLNSGSSSVLVHNINLGSKIKNSNVENQGLLRKSTKHESLIGVPMIKQITKYYFGQEKNNSNLAPTPVKQINSDSGSIKKSPSLLVRNIHLGSGNSFMGFTSSSIDKNNNTLIQNRAKSRLAKITNTLTNETKAQPITNVFIHSIKLGSDTPSMKRKDFMWQRIFSKGKDMNISIDGKTLQLKSTSAKNIDRESVERAKSASVRDTSLNLGSSPFITEERKETFFSLGSSSVNSSRENTTNTFVHSINLSSKSSSERKKSVSVLGSKEKVITNENTLNEKSNLERFPTKIKGMNQRRKKIGGREGEERERNSLISEKPRVNVLNVNLNSASSITKRKEARNRQGILQNDRKSLATETRRTGQVNSVVKEGFLTPTFHKQLVFNWNALDNGKDLQGQIHSKKQDVEPIFGNKSHFRYIFSEKNGIDRSNQMTGSNLNVPRGADLANNDGKNNNVAEYDKKEQEQFVVQAKHTVICHHLVDIIFVLDGSDSIDIPRMEQMKMFVINFMSGFQIHQMAALFGAVIYSSNVSGVINLGSIANRSSLYAAIHDLPHEMSGTNTARGIQSMREMVAMHSRREVPKVAIVITDGRSKNYSLTTTQARLAHQEGITIFAVGVGQLIDKNELRDIATYGKVRTVDSFHELQKLTYQLAREVCTLITPTTTTFTTTAAPTTMTTHAPTMNIITLINQTKYYSLPSNICEKCRLVNGVGYREHPVDCQLYIQCYFVGSVITSVTRYCGPGQFWDQQALTCKPAQLVNCITDRCRISELHSYQNRNNCRAYWTCIGGKSYGRCCQDGHSYVEATGCVQNKTCQQSCELKQLSSEICSLKTVPGDDTAFQQDIVGHGWTVQKCAPGTFFNISTCSCNASFRRPHNFTRKCKPEIHLTFDEKDGDDYQSRNGIKSENVTVQNGVADFNGNSRLLLWRFANAYLGKKIFIQVKFMERGHSNHTEAIVSNGDCGHDPSLYIALERETKRMHMGAVTDIGASDIRIAYNTNGWKEVTYMYDGDHVTASVNRIRKTGRTIAGSIESRHCAMQIGAGYGMRNFNGKIDEISFYLCKPENI